MKIASLQMKYKKNCSARYQTKFKVRSGIPALESAHLTLSPCCMSAKAGSLCVLQVPGVSLTATEVHYAAFLFLLGHTTP